MAQKRFRNVAALNPTNVHLENTPFLAWHVDGATAWIDVLFIPRAQRRHGFGRRLVNELVSRLPPTVREVEVLSAQIDDEFSTPFWQKLGFEPDDQFEELMSGIYLRRHLRD